MSVTGQTTSEGWATPFYDREVREDGMIFAGFWERFFAMVIDGAFSFSLGALPGFVLLFALRGSGIALAIILLGWILGYFIYQIVAVAYGGGFGMRHIGIRVVRVEDGRRPGLVRATVRLIARTIFGSVPIAAAILGPADALWMIKDPHKQTLHDKVARTYVIER